MTLRSGKAFSAAEVLGVEESGVEIRCADSTLRKERLYGVGARHFTSSERIVKENPAVCLLESIGGGRLSSGRLIKRACGLCAGLTGAPMEVKSNSLRGFSNPAYPYVNCCGLLQFRTSRTGLLWGRFMQEASREGDEGLLW